MSREGKVLFVGGVPYKLRAELVYLAKKHRQSLTQYVITVLEGHVNAEHMKEEASSPREIGLYGLHKKER